MIRQRMTVCVYCRALGGDNSGMVTQGRVSGEDDTEDDGDSDALRAAAMWSKKAGAKIPFTVSVSLSLWGLDGCK